MSACVITLNLLFRASKSDVFVNVVWSNCLSDIFNVCVLGEAADITTAPAEAEDEGHQKPRPLQSPK